MNRGRYSYCTSRKWEYEGAQDRFRVFYTCGAPAGLRTVLGAIWRILLTGVQDAARPRRGLSPPEERSTNQGSNEPPFRPPLRTPGMTLRRSVWSSSSTIVTSPSDPTSNNFD